MIRHILLPSIVIAATLTAARGAEPDRLNVRAAAWQKAIEQGPSTFNESSANVLYALSQFGGSCQIRMIYDPAKRGALTFEFVKDGKLLVTIEGHQKSVFRAEKNVLYFAHFASHSPGCTVTAHDLDTGNKLWETKLNAVHMAAAHSLYSNEVTMGLASLTGTDDAGEGIVSIRGHETWGDYTEILDRATGELLAQKVKRRR